MTIPMKYEDLVFQLNELNKREAALREELATSRAAFKEELDGVKYTRRKFRQERDALQQRLTVAEQRAGELEGLLGQVVSRCDYSLSCGKEELSKNCTAEIENIKLVAGGYSDWDCFALIDGKVALNQAEKTIRADAIHLNQAGCELLLEATEQAVKLKQAEEFLKWRVSRTDMEYLKELEDYAEGKWVSEHLSHYKQFGEFEDMYDGWRFEAWVARGQMIED